MRVAESTPWIGETSNSGSHPREGQEPYSEDLCSDPPGELKMVLIRQLFPSWSLGVAIGGPMAVRRPLGGLSTHSMQGIHVVMPFGAG